MKSRSSLLTGFALCVLLPVMVRAQPFVSFSSGIAKDVNNVKKSFFFIPVSLQWQPFKDKTNSLFFEFDYDIPLTCKSSGDAYSSNPSLPAKVILQENIHSYIFTASIGVKINIYTNKKNNTFCINLLTGICNQEFKVDYKNYDKTNYEVLNPDVNRETAKWVFSMAGVYNFHQKIQDMFVMLHVQSPLLTGKYTYPLSFKYIAPLQLTFGYKMFYKKRK